jgi:hypothetical protein
MALFVKHVTTLPRGPFHPNAVLIPSGATHTTDPGFSASPSQLTPATEVRSPHLPRPKPGRSLTSGLSRAVSHLKRRASSSAVHRPSGIVATPGDTSISTPGYLTPKSPSQSDVSVDVADQRRRSENDSARVPVAGEPKVYAYHWVIFQKFQTARYPNTDTTKGQSRTSKHDSRAGINAWSHPPTGARNRIARYESPL